MEENQREIERKQLDLATTILSFGRAGEHVEWQLDENGPPNSEITAAATRQAIPMVERALARLKASVGESREGANCDASCD